jgi:Effector Associated Constant Component 1
VPEEIEARITVGGDSKGDLGSLYEWLRREDGLRGRVRFECRPFHQEEMGAAQDAIAVALGSGGALTVLASALPTWMRQRRGSYVKVEITDTARGLRFVVEADKADHAERVLQQALDAVT